MICSVPFTALLASVAIFTASVLLTPRLSSANTASAISSPVVASGVVVEKRDVVRNLLAQAQNDEFRRLFAKAFYLAKRLRISACNGDRERFKVVSAENLHCHLRSDAAYFDKAQKELFFFETGKPVQ